MRTLSFVVSGQSIKMDSSCNFDGLVPGTEEYLRAEFSFSPEWNNCVKVASFTSEMGKEYPPQILKDGSTCIIPAEALKRRSFNVKIVGKDAKGTVITTHKVKVTQNGGRA